MEDRDGVKLGPVTKPPDGMVHCPDCGEYLGDYVDGILYKVGQVVTEPHECPKGAATLKRETGEGV